MFSNSLTLKGKIRKLLSQCKTIVLNSLNINRNIYLNHIWKNLDFPKQKQVIIIANGPSFNKDLAEAIISKRKFFDIAVMNNYFLNDYSDKIVPNYYVLSDPEHVETRSVNQTKLNETLKKFILDNNVKLLAPNEKRWEQFQKSFIPFNDFQNLSSSNIDPRKPRGYTSNTGFKAIALMLALKYKKIYIMGLDFDYPRKLMLDKNNKIYLKREHSYGDTNANLSHEFDSIGHALSWWSENYWHLRKLKSEKIVNVTNNSMVDSFSRMTPGNFINTIQELK